MATVTLTPGTLPPPACYPTEQARFDAYVAAILATISGGIQWQDGTGAPSDVGLYWLRQAAAGAPGLEPLKWSIPDSAWTRWLSSLHNAGTAGGSSNAYTYTQSPAAPPAEAYRLGATYIFKATFANTGAATLSVDGLTAVPLKKHGAIDLAQGDILANQVVVAVHDGTNFQMVSDMPIPPPPAFPATYTTGLLDFAPSIVSQNYITGTHTIGQYPLIVDAYFQCHTADATYAPGDRVFIDQVWDEGGGDQRDLYALSFNATNWTLSSYQQGTPTVIAKNGGSHQTFTPANWRLVVNMTM